jgi:hypothetical protein
MLSSRETGFTKAISFLGVSFRCKINLNGGTNMPNSAEIPTVLASVQQSALVVTLGGVKVEERPLFIYLSFI